MQDFFDQEPNRFDRQIPWEQDHPSYPKKEGSRGLLVFSVAMLLLAAFCLFGSF